MQKTSGALLAVVALAASSALTQGYSCNPACQFRGTINQPENLSMLRKAMGDLCKQMTTRSDAVRVAHQP